MICTTGQVPQRSSALPTEGTSAFAEVQGVEPGHTRRTGSPTQLPIVGEHSGEVVLVVLLQPTVVRRPGVHVKVPLVRQPQSREMPVLAVAQIAVTLGVVPPQLVEARTHVPAVAVQPEMAVVGPVDEPAAQRPALEHQPQPTDTVAAEQVPQVAKSAHGSVGGTSGAQGPQSAEQVVQFSPREAVQTESPQKSSTGTSGGGGQGPQSRSHDEHVSAPLQSPSPQRGPTSRATSG